MKKILASKVSIDSAKLLRDRVEYYSGYQYYIVTEGEKVTKNGIVFRYGNTDDIIGPEGFNTQNFVYSCIHKKLMSNILSKNGFYTPKFYKTFDKKPDKFPVLVRESLTKEQGIGIHLVNNQDEFNKIYQEDYWWTPFVTLEFELRVIVFKDEVLNIFKKLPPEEVVNEQDEIICNEDWRWKLRNNENYPKIHQIVKELYPIVKSLGGDFYGMDIGWDGLNKKYFILELNSGSWLSPTSSANLAKKISENL